MKKSKSVFVAALVALMMAVIIAGLYLLKSRAWLVLAGLLCLYGYLCGAVNFGRWLGQETPLLPAGRGETLSRGGYESFHADKEDDVRLYGDRAEAKPLSELWTADEGWNADYEAIKAELEAEGQT